MFQRFLQCEPDTSVERREDKVIIVFVIDTKPLLETD